MAVDAGVAVGVAAVAVRADLEAAAGVGVGLVGEAAERVMLSDARLRAVWADMMADTGLTMKTLFLSEMDVEIASQICLPSATRLRAVIT